jgi:hypothetical protein
MKLTRDHLPLLRRARDLIESEEFIYICNAAHQAGRDIGAPFELDDDIVKVIEDGLRGVYYPSTMNLEVWLAAQLNINYRRLRETTTRLARLAWLDRLIYDLEN